MKHQGRGIIRLNDKTTHGGYVTSATSETKVLGKFAAVQGDQTFCPQCKGTFKIKPDGHGAKHEGKPYAYQDDITECGARLISSV